VLQAWPSTPPAGQSAPVDPPSAPAQELPDPTRAEAVAYDYSGQAGAKNDSPNVRDVKVEVLTRCLTTIPGCDPVNAVVVKETAKVKTIFAGVFGINSFDLRVTSTACSPLWREAARRHARARPNRLDVPGPLGP
jgi:hypothetical protein